MREGAACPSEESWYPLKAVCPARLSRGGGMPCYSPGSESTLSFILEELLSEQLVCKIGINLPLTAIPKRSSNVLPSIFSMWYPQGLWGYDYPQGFARGKKVQLSQQDLNLWLGDSVTQLWNNVLPLIILISITLNWAMLQMRIQEHF